MELSALGPMDGHVRERLKSELVSPAIEFMSRSSKGIRRKLVTAGRRWLKPIELSELDMRLCEELGEALELIHSASLIIDDIQDASPVRRGEDAVHVKIGTGRAINVANWIYFKAFEKIDRLSISDEKRLTLFRLFRQALLKGHAGQALDLGIPMGSATRSSARGICEASFRLKTGALTGLAFAAGAALSDAQAERLQDAFAIGERIGVILQALDDLKNLKPDPLALGKRYEDLRNERPGLLWLIASEHEESKAWSDLLMAARALPDDRPISEWLTKFAIVERSLKWLEERISELRQHCGSNSDIEDILQQLVKSYEKL